MTRGGVVLKKARRWAACFVLVETTTSQGFATVPLDTAPWIALSDGLRMASSCHTSKPSSLRTRTG